MSVQFDNLKSWKRNIKSKLNGLETEAFSGVNDAVFFLFKETSRFTPKKSGNLASSRKTNVEKRGGFIEGSLSYNENGGASYAIEQHENPNYSHDKPWNPPEASYKFLEKPLLNNQKDIFSIIAKRTKFK